MTHRCVQCGTFERTVDCCGWPPEPPPRFNLSDYPHRARGFATYPDPGNNATYAALGLVGEAGEFADKVKKVIRDHGGDPAPLREAMLKELGDVLWYVAMCAFELNSSLEEVARMNIEKLESRAARGVLHGEGDER